MDVGVVSRTTRTSLCYTLASAMIFGVLVFAMLGGMAFAAIPAVLKVKTGAHEVVTTIMLNGIAVSFLAWALNGPLKFTATEGAFNVDLRSENGFERHITKYHQFTLSGSHQFSDTFRLTALLGTIAEHNAAWRAWFDRYGVIPYEITYERRLADEADLPLPLQVDSAPVTALQAWWSCPFASVSADLAAQASR